MDMPGTIMLAVIAMQLPIGIAVGRLLRGCRHLDDDDPAVPSDCLGCQSRPYTHDTPQARARRVAARQEERDALEAAAEAGRLRRQERDERRRLMLIIERVRYGLPRSGPHIDDMVA